MHLPDQPTSQHQNNHQPPAPAADEPPAPPFEQHPHELQQAIQQAMQPPDQVERVAPGSITVDAVRLLADTLAQMRPPQRAAVWAALQHTLSPETWREAAAQFAHFRQAQRALRERRLRGDYQTDPYGMDPDMVEAMRPFFRFLYHKWWRVQTWGIEHVPATGRALLVSNHSGVLPWDGSVIAMAVWEEHPAPRMVRNLYLNWFNTMPFIAPVFAGLGQMAGLPENALRLLEEDELVCTFPEGLRGMAKLFHQRYQLGRFGRGGFVKVALRTGTPIIPVAVVGAEEIYPLLSRGERIARLLGTPLFPLTPFFPLLGPLGVIPLPTRWRIVFCPPIATADYGPEAADDPLTVFALTEQVRSTIQQTINAQLVARTSIFK
jgi:1-acyl-sn-glycerol-3-phosphate acyltransferase